MSAIVNGRYTKGVSFLLNMVYKRGKGLDLGADPPPPGEEGGAGTVFQGRSQDFSRGTHKFPKPLPQTP